MRDEQKMVEEFHRKLGFPVDVGFVPLQGEEILGLVEAAAGENHDTAEALLKASIDARLDVSDRVMALRLHLIAEEFSEALAAVHNGDEQEFYDALLDMLYVILGTGVVFDFPLAAGFAEVHRSNMTKERQPSDKFANRVRSKGPNYVPPDLKGIMVLHKAMRKHRTGRTSVRPNFSLQQTVERNVAVPAEHFEVYMSVGEHARWVADGKLPIALSEEDRTRLNLRRQDAGRPGMYTSET